MTEITPAPYESPAIFEIGSLHDLTLAAPITKDTGAYDGVQFQGINIGIPS